LRAIGLEVVDRTPNPDNRGSRSPGTLTPGLDELEVGQRVMGMFSLASFERDRHLTLRTAAGRFGTFFVTYRVDSHAPDRCRLVVKLVAELPGGLVGRVLAALFPWADLLMMRRQLLNLKGYAERDA
jgi:catechol 2,3-dioxygenase-like lactoylglutathione lyase family enzyme